jgi:transposase
MKNADPTQELIELKQRFAALELQLSEKNITLKKQDDALENKDHKIQTLEEYIRSMIQQRFGSSSEKLSVDQIHLFDEAELLSDDDELAEEESTNVPAHKRKKKRASIPEALPRTEVIHDLATKKKCVHTMAQHCVILAMKHQSSSITSPLK